jgi:hypothetical protein
MSNSTSTTVGREWPPEWPAEVAAFAAEVGVTESLPRVLEMTRRVFPTARRLEVLLVEDAEVEDDWRIVFEVEGPLTWQEAARAQDRWCRELFQCCPAAHACYFILGMRPVK